MLKPWSAQGENGLSGHAHCLWERPQTKLARETECFCGHNETQPAPDQMPAIH